MSISINSTSCCGLNDIDGLADYRGDPEAAMKDFCDVFYKENNTSKCAHMIFTGITSSRYGQQFASFINKHKLGVIKKSPSHKNLKSGHFLTAWLWTLNRPNIKTWALKNAPWTIAN